VTHISPAKTSPAVQINPKTPSLSSTHAHLTVNTTSLTRTPVYTATPSKPICLSAGGYYEAGSVEIELLRSDLDYQIYLPPCYREQTDRRYPVLYLFHGQSYLNDQWDRIGADETADRLIMAGEIPPLLIVMPYDEFGGQPSENRFADAVVQNLVPHIDNTYRTKADRIYRAVGGLSRGGGWAIHLALVKWETFGVMGAHSPAVFFSDAEQMRTFLDELPVDYYPRMYIDIGAKDRPEIMRAAIWFEELLNVRGIPHEWHLFAGYHNEEYWSQHMQQYLLWYTKGW